MKILTLTAAAALAMTAATASAQTLRVGTEGAYPPYNFTDADGNLIGFEIDLAREMCAVMEMECEFVSQDWDGMIPALLIGRYDVIMAGMSITDERRERIAFSQGYSQTPAWFVAHVGSELQQAVTIEDVVTALEGATVGVQVATIHQNFLDAEIPNIEVRLYDTQELLALDLEAGRIDAGLADATAWEPFFETDTGADYINFGPGLTGADFPVFGEGVGVGMRQEDTALLADVNAALCTLEDNGTLGALAIEWFGYDASLPCPE